MFIWDSLVISEYTPYFLHFSRDLRHFFWSFKASLSDLRNSCGFFQRNVDMLSLSQVTTSCPPLWICPRTTQSSLKMIGHLFFLPACLTNRHPAPTMTWDLWQKCQDPGPKMSRYRTKGNVITYRRIIGTLMGWIKYITYFDRFRCTQ